MKIEAAKLIKSQLPLRLKLCGLRLAAFSEPQKPILLNWGRRHLDLKPEYEKVWCRRAYWGVTAGEAVRFHLQKRSTRESALHLIEESSWEEVEAVASYGGAILAAAHIGPPKLAMHALVKRKLPLMVWTATGGETPNWANNADAIVLDPRMHATRSEILMKSAFHLRNGGFLFAAPDASSGSQLIRLNKLNKTWNFSRGVPALARTLGVPTFLVMALWQKNRVKMTCTPIKPPSEDCSEEEWDRLWISSYWEKIEEIVRTSPENLRFLIFEKGLKAECGL